MHAVNAKLKPQDEKRIEEELREGSDGGAKKRSMFAIPISSESKM